MIVGEMFVLKEVTGFVLLGLVKWLLGGGWLPLLIYLGFIALCACLGLMCEDVGFKNIIFTHMDGNKRAVIVKVSRGFIHVFDFFIGIQMVIGIVVFYRYTETVLNRWILLETHVFNALQLSVFYVFLGIIPDIFSVGENGKGKLGQ